MTHTIEFEKALSQFFNRHPPQRVSKHLRVLLMEALANTRITTLPDFHDILFDIEALFNLMDQASEDQDAGAERT